MYVNISQNFTTYIMNRNCLSCNIDISFKPSHHFVCDICYQESIACEHDLIKDWNEKLLITDAPQSPDLEPERYINNNIESTCFSCSRRFSSISTDYMKILCPNCRPINIPQTEARLARKGYSHKSIAWLNSIANKDGIHIQHALNGGEHKVQFGKYTFSFDGYCEETNTVYEFYGDKYHGNPRVHPADEIIIDGKTAGELYKKTKWREGVILKAGYNLITIWEYDYDNKQT